MEKRRQKNEAAGPYKDSAPQLALPNPFESVQSSRGDRSGLSPKQNLSNINGVAAGNRGDVPRTRGHNSNRHARESSDDVLQRERPIWDPQTSKNNSDPTVQGRCMGKRSIDAQGRGVRGARSAPNSAGRSKPTQTNLVPFEVKMADFPELAGVSLGRTGTPVIQKECWGPNLSSVSHQSQKLTSLKKTGRKESPKLPAPQQEVADAAPDSTVSPVQAVVTSWANVASQPPKKPAPKETIIGNHTQMEDVAAEQEEGATMKKKRKKKKKKAKGAGEDAEFESEEPSVYQEPPRFEDEEEFPGLCPALTGTDRLTTSNKATKLCNEENQRDQFNDQNKEKSAAKSQPAETAKKGQKVEKLSGKKSKAPVQLDFGNMLAVLEKKQQSQKDKQDTKPVISVGGGLPVIQKQPAAQKKPPWQQDKIAHNPLDSTSPLVKKGKQREVPKAKKPTPLKKVILKEREERKQRRLLEERGLLPENESTAAIDTTEENQCDTNPADEEISAIDGVDDGPELNDTDEVVSGGEGESDIKETVELQTTSTIPNSTDLPKIHSRKFREYCSQMLSKDVDECVTTLLKELVRFQDRLYQKDPMKARMKRRIVMGLREVLKHLKLRKVKCVIISPNCERIQSKGGLDEALHTIIDTCREQGVPFVFALSRKALGRCVNKMVPVSLVGIFNYDGAQDVYHKMIELSSEARRAYEEMMSSLEQTGQAEAEPEVNTEELQMSSQTVAEEPALYTTQLEEPEYMKIWKKMLENDCNHKFLNFEEQLSAMHLDGECYENTDEDKKS
ncbi:selenocysteine insertion sequence-binding protein 2-like isoform 2-T2 [Aulostomus maculatus]